MPRFANPGEAEAAARAFDLKQLPACFIDDPYPYFHALRQYDPVHRMPDGSYIITRYDDCETLYKDAKTYSSDKKVEFHPKFGDTTLFEGAGLTGPGATVDYVIPALAPGEYTFICDFHPIAEMTGTLTAE